MSEVVVIGALKARPEKADEAELALNGLVDPTHAEAGCVLYALHRGADDPTRFVFVERWASRAELDAHLQSAHLAALVERVDELFTEPPDITVYEARPQGDPAKGALAQ